jgi:hypothetical protein
MVGSTLTPKSPERFERNAPADPLTEREAVGDGLRGAVDARRYIFDLVCLDARTERFARHPHDFDLAPAGVRGAGLRIDREPQRRRRLRGEPVELQRGE